MTRLARFLRVDLPALAVVGACCLFIVLWVH